MITLAMIVTACAMALIDRFYYKNLLNEVKNYAVKEYSRLEQNKNELEVEVRCLKSQLAQEKANAAKLKQKNDSMKSVYDTIKPTIKNTSHIIAMLERKGFE